MTTYTNAQAASSRKPPSVVVVPRSAFADTYARKPDTDVAIGLRLLSETDIQTARTEAARQAVDWYADRDGNCIDPVARDEAYNDALIRHAVARGACDPNDLTLSYFEPAPEEIVRSALTSDGARRLWDELVRLHLTQSVSLMPASDEDVGALARMLSAGLLARLPDGAQAEARKLLAHVLGRLDDVFGGREAATAATGATVPTDDDSEDVSTYVVRGG